MEIQYAVCCGIDVHKKLLVCCVREGDKTEIIECGTSTREILELSDLLLERGCEAVAMESTGSYWKPIYNIFEQAGIYTMVVNAQHMRNVPGRKTDVKDAEWISDLLYHGLLTSSYIPEKRQRELRELVSYRKSLVKTRAAELNRLQKMLEGANIKISGTISNIDGMSGRSLLDVIESGEVFDAKLYDRLLKEKKISKRLKAGKNRLIDDMNGCLSPTQFRMIREIRSHIQELENHIRQLNQDIDDSMNDEEKEDAKRLETVPGISDSSSKIILAVIGTDMSRFPTARHLSSWAGLCPGNHESAGKKKNGRTNKGNKLLRTTLVICAHSAVTRKDCYYSALYNKIAAHRGKKRAIVAVAHSMLQAIYYILKKKEPYMELGADYYASKNREGKIKGFVKKLSALGVIVPETEIQKALAV